MEWQNINDLIKKNFLVIKIHWKAFIYAFHNSNVFGFNGNRIRFFTNGHPFLITNFNMSTYPQLIASKQTFSS
uniref:Uncharacterized protein n=1 Tax=viral metagenome TaxID=1070528 RepID=A0A6C0C9R0_9ZZZZ